MVVGVVGAVAIGVLGESRWLGCRDSRTRIAVLIPVVVAGVPRVGRINPRILFGEWLVRWVGRVGPPPYHYRIAVGVVVHWHIVGGGGGDGSGGSSGWKNY